MKSLIESILDDNIASKINDKVETNLKDLQNMNKISDEVMKWAEDKLKCKFEEIKLDPRNPRNYKRYTATIPNVPYDTFKKQKPKIKKLFDQIGSKLGFKAVGYTHRSLGNVVEMHYQNSKYDIHTPCSISSTYDYGDDTWGLRVTITKYNV